MINNLQTNNDGIYKITSDLDTIKNNSYSIEQLNYMNVKHGHNILID